MRLRARHVVGDGDGGAAEAFHAIDDQPVDHRAHDRVEAGGRLVEEHDRRFRGDGAGQGHALLHAAGEFGGGEPGHRRRPARPGPAPRPLCPAPPPGAIFFSASRPKATFSQTGRLSNSAPFWNSMPICAAQLAGRGARGAFSTSSPSISMLPASGVTRPRMDLISTDLPVPEPPMTTMPVPGMTSRSTPSSTRFSPKAFFRPRMLIFGWVI